MFKNLVLIFITTIALNANLNDKAQNILGEEVYFTNKTLIDFLLKDPAINYNTMLKKLKENKLLKIKFEKKQEIEVNFILNDDSLKSFLILKKILKSLGYYNFLTKELTRTEKTTIWKISLITEAAIDPLYLSQALLKRSAQIEDIIKEGEGKYSYFINSTNSKLKALEFDEESNILSLKKPSKEYMLFIKDAKKLNIHSKPGNRWRPNIVFYDDKLNIINVLKKDSFTRNLVLDIPEKTIYIKINDLYSLNNLKKGIKITKELKSVSRD